VARTGVPRQIVSDGAADLNNGIARFQRRHPATLAVPDVAHQVANLLKHSWEGDPAWGEFTRRMNATAVAIRQTRAAHVMAPRLRNKGRFMSVGAFVRFGRMLLERLRSANPDPEVVRWYGWVTTYAESLRVWGEQHALTRATLHQVRVEGLFARGAAELEAAWEPLGVSDEPRTVALRNRLRAYVSRWESRLRPGERLVGSTEVLEWAFGVQKRLSRTQSTSGLTELSVGVGALLGSATAEELRSDLERVPEKAVSGWSQRLFGATVQWLRRRFRDGQATANAVPDPG